MSDRSFIEIWSLSYDDIAWVESFNRSSRVWAALQLRFFRRHGRFPSRDGDLDGNGLTPLIYLHINPYGRYEVDLDNRIDFDRLAA
ncbi:hypothetical protein [Aquicoccus sp. SU-CL01552]|uniref:hypothetical protein n=1 Tax=Aquicoccus sp. SU-CL01552 TaxID=3127656 RepID=UPI0031061A0F